MAGDIGCSVDGFGEAIMSAMTFHVDGQRRATEALVRKAASTSAKELRSGARTPRRTGDYASSFRMKRTSGGDGMETVEYTVGNTGRRGNLTHLLEDGHQLFYYGHPTGTRTRAFPHIAPAYELGAELIRKASVEN